MAIYHCDLSTISRSNGSSATASAAYRAGVKIEDRLTGQTFDYTKKQKNVLHSELIAPPSVLASLERAELWNAAEAAENRKNSVVARELLLAIPHELDREAQKTLASEYGRRIAERYGVAVDLSIHAAHRKNKVAIDEGTSIGGDPRNVHCHLMFTTRSLNPDGSFGAKTRVLDAAKTGSAEVSWMRSEWQAVVNQRLAQAGKSARVDARSLKDRGIDRMPQIHVGPPTTGRLSHRGGLSRRLAAWLAIRAENRRAEAAKTLAALDNEVTWHTGQAETATKQLRDLLEREGGHLASRFTSIFKPDPRKAPEARQGDESTGEASKPRSSTWKPWKPK